MPAVENARARLKGWKIKFYFQVPMYWKRRRGERCNVSEGKRLSSATAARKRLEPDYIIDFGRRVVSVRFGRKLGLDDIKLYAKSLAANPLFDPSFSEIVDLTAVEDLQLNAASAVSLADQVDPFDLGAKRAFIAKTAAQVNAARMHQILWSEKSIKIFTSEGPAREWLETPRHSRHRTPGL